MKLQVGNLYDLAIGLNDLANKELPISTSLKIQRSQKAVSEELISADKIRHKIIEKYKEKEVDEGIKIKEGKMELFNKEINELMKQEIDINLNKIDVKELKGISVKPKTLMLLDKILKQDTE